MVSEGQRSSLGGFSAPDSYRAENLSDISNDPGVHVVWDSGGELIYAGYTTTQRTRLQQHLTGDRLGSVLHDKVGRLLDRELGREATRDEIREWLWECTVAWKMDADPKALKARILEEFHPRFNQAVPSTQGGDSVDDVWDEFAYWARYFFEKPNFDTDERDYKIRLGDEFSLVRTSVLGDGDTWLEPLSTAFKSKNNNLSRWNQHDQYLKWAATSPDLARSSLEAIWGSEGIADAVTRWSEQTPKDAASGLGTRTMFASLLLLGVDPIRYPPFKPSVVANGYGLVGFSTASGGNTESEQYQAALNFFDRIVEECNARDVQLRDRLDAQGVLWTILNVDAESVDESERLAAFRGKPIASTWWVNQGGTYGAEREGGYVWAPQRTEEGAVLGHWLNVFKLNAGDVVVHYANGAVRAISEVRTRGKPSPKPDELGDAWESEGYRADVTYFDLENPISLDEIPLQSRIDEANTFNRNGGVNQGYMYAVSANFADELFDLFENRWPIDSPWGPFTGNYWIFQGNPDKWDFDKGLVAFEDTDDMTWTVSRFREEMSAGDQVAIWKSGPEAGIYALAELAGEPVPRADDEKFTDSDGDEWAAPLRSSEILDPPIYRSEIIRDSILSQIGVIRAPQGTNFKVSQQQWQRLMELITGTPPSGGSLGDVVGAVSGGLLDVGLGFGLGHLGFVRSFVVSLAAKGFVLLTGLSGSGKSRLALGFGEWLGLDRLWVEAVRPDWTGPDALLGFEDGLSVRDGQGRLGWQVPGVLEFMLGAARDEDHPYLLLLDEMNLAHVERYFADVLSGMESGADVLPNLVRGGDGVWREQVGGPSRLKFPSNLLVVGTVNIDETTYMFSPKVLDRANTLEFRVASDDLVASAEPIGVVESGSDELVRVFLEAVTSVGGDWSGRDEMAGWLRELHGLLAVEDREFGHRVFFEALRFGGLLAEAGESDALMALDLQVMQKVLPRVHGSIRQVGSTLERLGAWCFYGPGVPLPDSFDPLDPPEGDPRLPVSFDKTARMTRRLRANHFVSYAE